MPRIFGTDFLLRTVMFASAFFIGAEGSAHAAQPSATVNIGAVMRPKDGKAAELRATLLSLVGPTHEESGCVIYNVYEGTDGSFFLYEVWRSHTDFEAHIQKPYIQDFINRTGDLLEGANDAHFGKLISGPVDANGDVHQNRATPNTVNIISIKKPREGKTAELREALLSLVKRTREEAGHISYNIYEESDGSLFLYEVWRSQEDWEKHFRQPYIKDFRSKADDLAERNEVYFGKLISASAR